MSIVEWKFIPVVYSFYPFALWKFYFKAGFTERQLEEDSSLKKEIHVIVFFMILKSIWFRMPGGISCIFRTKKCWWILSQYFPWEFFFFPCALSFCIIIKCLIHTSLNIYLATILDQYSYSNLSDKWRSAIAHRFSLQQSDADRIFWAVLTFPVWKHAAKQQTLLTLYSNIHF